MLTQQKIFFDFLRFCIGVDKDIPASAKDANWNVQYAIAKKQALVGVVFDGISKLPKGLAPDSKLLMRWMRDSLAIKQSNAVMYKASLEVFSEIKKAGFRCCILKGQGNAVVYPNQYSRSAGDVDVWVLSDDRQKLRQLALELADSPSDISREIVQHIELTRKGVSVELHPTPMMFNNLILNQRMQRWFKHNADLQCSNLVDLPDGIGQIAVPTNTFNIIYQLSHLHHHFFYEGVGLRQIIDYYFVVEKWHADLTSNEQSMKSECGKDVLQRDLKHLGLWSFCGAVMYVLHEVLSLSKDKMIVPMDVKRGKLLLDEILSGGNFGHYDERFTFGHSAIGHNLQRLYRDLRLVRYYPAEALSEPIFRIWHFLWRMKNKK